MPKQFIIAFEYISVTGVGLHFPSFIEKRLCISLNRLYHRMYHDALSLCSKRTLWTVCQKTVYRCLSAVYLAWQFVEVRQIDGGALLKTGIQKLNKKFKFFKASNLSYKTHALITLWKSELGDERNRKIVKKCNNQPHRIRTRWIRATPKDRRFWWHFIDGAPDRSQTIAADSPISGDLTQDFGRGHSAPCLLWP